MSAFVLDCSITMSWCFEDERTRTSQQILQSLTGNTAIVPSIWPLEVANVLIVAQRQKRITRADAERFLALLDDLPITVDTDIRPIDALRIALDLRLSAYDAAYVELATRRALPFATKDRKLTAAAKQVGIPIVA